MNTDTHAGRTCNHFTRPDRGGVDKDKSFCSPISKYTGQHCIVKLHAEDEKAAAHHGHWQWHEQINGGSNLLWQRLGGQQQQTNTNRLRLRVCKVTGLWVLLAKASELRLLDSPCLPS